MKKLIKHLAPLCLILCVFSNYTFCIEWVNLPAAFAAGGSRKPKVSSPLKLTPLSPSSKEPQLEPILPPFEAIAPNNTPDLKPLPDIQKKLTPVTATDSLPELEPKTLDATPLALPTLPKPINKKPLTKSTPDESTFSSVKPKPVPAYPILPKVNLLLNGENFSVEVAQKLEDQLRGLMFRESLPPKTGMMFLFSPPRAVNFWMKNCKVSLDMIFIRNSTVVNTAENAAPCLKDPCPVYGSIYAVDTVVELPAGSVKQFAIQPGDKIVLRKNPSTTAYNTETGYNTESQTTRPVPEMQPELPNPTKP